MSTRTRLRSSGICRDALVQRRIETLTAAFYRKTHAWWLTPADQYDTSSYGTSTSSHRPTINQYTEWHRPSTSSLGATRCNSDVHGHRVGVVEQPRVGAHLRHVLGDAGEDGKCPEPTKIPPIPMVSLDGLVQPVPGRSLEVAHRRPCMPT